MVKRRALVGLSLVVSTHLYGGFDFGAGSCEGGSGTFQQEIEYWDGDRERAVTVGEIPKNLKDIYISLESEEDVDIRLYGEDGEKIVHWPDGILKGATEESITYNGVVIEYSGYNGDGSGKGHEYIKIMGTTQNSFIMKAFGYKAGYARVDYSWAGDAECEDSSTPSPSGSGDFQQKILEGDIVTIGDIPPDVKNLYIELISDEDVDIQLYDKDDGVKIIAWPDGILRGRDRESTEYKGMEIEWSGYNGDGSGKGHEYIKIIGDTSCNLTMKAYGYRAGYAKVHYEWGDDDATDDNSIVGRVTFDRVNPNSNHIGLNHNNISHESGRGLTVKLIGEGWRDIQEPQRQM